MQSRLRSSHYLRVPFSPLCSYIGKVGSTLSLHTSFKNDSGAYSCVLHNEFSVGYFNTTGTTGWKVPHVLLRVEVCLQESSGILTLSWCLHITLSFLVSGFGAKIRLSQVIDTLAFVPRKSCHKFTDERVQLAQRFRR